MLDRLNAVATRLVAPGKGILAADEATAAITKRFESIGLASTEDSRRDYREMLFGATDAMSSCISGVILFDETIRQKSASGQPLVDMIKSTGAIPGIKLDIGQKPLPFCPGEVITEGLDGLAERVAEYAGLGAEFGKWRAVISIGTHLPSDNAVTANTHALARYAAICQQGGLVPIVEPDILMDGDHDIDKCAEVTEWVLKEQFHQLHLARVALEGIILKPNMVLSGKNLRNAGLARGSGRKNREGPEALRTLSGSRHRLPVRRPVERRCHPSSAADECHRQSPLAAHLFL